LITKLKTIDSTNEEAKRLIKSGHAQDGQIIIAEEQTGGHGRYDRVWHSPIGNLYASIILNLDYELQKISEISFVTAVALGEMLAEILPDEYKIEYKWSNDVLVNRHKISGVLLESVTNGAGGWWLVVGVGVNIRNKPEGLQNKAICLAQCGGEGISPDELLAKFMLFWGNQLNLWKNNGFGCIRDAYLKRACKINEVIDVNLPNEKLRGIFNGISINGELELLIDGDVRLISSGDVFFL
jgi:BirA family biotin operon repressor/biotin-[acetyl-CoA-carboxylase] ligase